jgi:glutamine amidotransferase
MKQTKDYIAIVDYQLSNMFSVKHALDHLGIPSIITSDPKEVVAAKAAVLPGVGAFGDAMANLKKFGLDKALKKIVANQQPLLGVCLGLQLLFTESTEFGRHKGLGFIKGDVVKFPAQNKKKEDVRVPQIGWNTIVQPKKKNWKRTPLKDLENNSFMYFVHSFYVRPKDTSVISSLTTYQGIEYCSSISSDTIFATQFHPEKSGEPGISIYKNWIEDSI